MGNDTSVLVDEATPPKTLSGRSLTAIANHINSGAVKKTVFLVGAGMSTSAGIPDFRSPGTGIYDNLQALNLDSPEELFHIDFFRTNPKPFYHMVGELRAEQCRPTICHALIREFERRGLLSMCFTQNIDTLERKAGISLDKIIEAHGTFATQSCIECQTSYPDDLMSDYVRRKEVPYCRQADCNGIVKPDIVFFGQPLPTDFHQSRRLLSEADLVIVIGSSLVVYPFAQLHEDVPPHIPRLLLNRERAGMFGTRPDDVIVYGACDDSARRLADLLGWGEAVESEWLRLVGEEEAAKQNARNKLASEVFLSTQNASEKATEQTTKQPTNEKPTGETKDVSIRGLESKAEDSEKANEENKEDVENEPAMKALAMKMAATTVSDKISDSQCPSGATLTGI